MMVLNCGGEEGIESKISGYFLDLLTPLILLYRDWNKGSRWGRSPEHGSQLMGDGICTRTGQR